MKVMFIKYVKICENPSKNSYIFSNKLLRKKNIKFYESIKMVILNFNLILMVLLDFIKSHNYLEVPF